MQPPSPVRQRPNVTNVLFMLLLGGLALGAILAFMVFRPSGSGPAFAVTAINANPCPSGEGAPACFQVLVENTGSEAANVRCELIPAEGTTAMFLSGDTVVHERRVDRAAHVDPALREGGRHARQRHRRLAERGVLAGLRLVQPERPFADDPHPSADPHRERISLRLRPRRGGSSVARPSRPARRRPCPGAPPARTSRDTPRADRRRNRSPDPRRCWRRGRTSAP